MKVNEYDNRGVLQNIEPDNIIVTRQGSIRKICVEDLPFLSKHLAERFATEKEHGIYKRYEAEKNLTPKVIVQ